MMERIGDHLTYLSKYATGNIAVQNSEEFQRVYPIFNNRNVVLLLICLS